MNVETRGQLRAGRERSGTQASTLALALASVVWAGPAGAQAQAWVARHHGPPVAAQHVWFGDAVDRFNGDGRGWKQHAMVADGAGNVYVTGGVDRGAGWSGLTIKYDAAGRVAWSTGPNGRHGVGLSLALDGAGGLYVGNGFGIAKYDADTGSEDWFASGLPAAGFWAPLIAWDGSGIVAAGNASIGKWNGAGERLWFAPLGFIARGLAVDSSANVYVSGETYIGNPAYATSKFSSAGRMEWTSFYAAPTASYNLATDVRVDAAGGVFVTGFSVHGTGTPSDVHTVKYNSAGKQQWVAVYDGGGDKYAIALVVDPAGNAYVLGQSDGGTSGTDYVVIKYGAAGAQQWAAVLNGGKDDRPYAITLDAAGDIYVTGASSGPGGLGYLTAKYDSAGASQWVARLAVPANRSDSARAVAADSSGNVWVAGTSSETLGGVESSELKVVRYSAAGALQWVAANPAILVDPDEWPVQRKGVAVDSAGNAYVLAASYNGRDLDYCLIKYTSAGTKVWVRTYAGPFGDDVPIALALDGAGNVYVTGSSWGATGGYDFLTVKYDPAGVQQWVAVHDSGAADHPRALAVDPSGNAYVTGSSDVSGSVATVKYDPSGAQLWVAASNYYTDGIGVDGSGGVYVAGTSDSRMRTIKYGPLGTLQWDVSYNGMQRVIAMAVDDSGEVYVTGSRSDNATRDDYVTVKYSSAGVREWAAVYAGPGSSEDVPTDLALGATGVYVTGTRSSSTVASTRSATVKYDAVGALQWVATHDRLGRAGWDVPSALALDAAGNAYVTGTSGVSYVSEGFSTLKYTSGGKEAWAAHYAGPQDGGGFAFALAVDAAGNPIVSGRSWGDGGYDIVTVKYTTDTMGQSDKRPGAAGPR